MLPSRFPRRRPFIYLHRHTPSGQSRVYQATQLHTDGVPCRESAGTGPVVLKVVPVTGAVFSIILWMDELMRGPVHSTSRYEIFSKIQNCKIVAFDFSNTVLEISFLTVVDGREQLESAHRQAPAYGIWRPTHTTRQPSSQAAKQEIQLLTCR